MAKNIIVILTLLLLSIIPTQVNFAQNNPFEIADRLEEVSQHIAIQDTNSIQSNTINTSADSEVLIVDIENPFEISHVPIRKKDYKTTLVNKRKTSKKNFFENTYPLWAILMSILLLSIVLSQNRNLITELSNSVLNSSTLNSLQKKYDSGKSLPSIILYSVFIINLGLFISKLIKNDQLSTYLYIILIISIIYISKHILIRITGYIFPIKELVNKVNFSIVSLHLFLGIVLIPINTILYFSQDVLASFFIYIGIFMLAVTYVLRWLKGIFFASNTISSYPFHFFIYLCSFEILPWIVGFKIFSSVVDIF